MKTYDDCKKQVAENRKFGSWNEMFGAYLRLGYFNPPHSIDFLCEELEKAYLEVAEVYAKSKANEAVDKVLDDLWQKREETEERGVRVILARHLKKYPLPYPEEQ